MITSNEAMESANIFGSGLKLAYTEPSTQNKAINTLYVFNKPQKKGFVIVAANDALPNTILGYTDNGEFDYETIPESLKWLLSYYSEQIDAIKGSVGNCSRNQSKIIKDSIIVPPLLGDVQWNQFAPYYNKCPKLFGEQTLVGCVATSMTSLMYFHKWPLSGQGRKSYKYMYHTYTEDFSKSTYDWPNILPRYTSEYSEEEANAISKLSYDAGISVEMQYGSDASNSHLEYVQKSLVDYFKYNSDVLMKYRGTITRENWNTILKKELDNLLPICISGSNPQTDVSHAFVCDGYTKNNYFHFNFGWNGQGDGYYLSSLDDEQTESSGVSFSSKQLIIYNIHPDNKHCIDGIYYHILSDTEVEVCSSISTSEYSGDIIIPSSVTIDGNQYEVTRIGCAAFGNCTEMTSLTLPRSIKLIEGNSIFGCMRLKTLNVLWQKPLDIYSNTFFEGTTSNVVLQVPSSSISAYEIAEGWNKFTSIKARILKGDINEDGIVDVADITEIARIILRD